MGEAGDEAAVTRLLHRWHQGDNEALDEVTECVYTELHRRARAYLRGERPGHTLDTTGLVHEAYLKLADKQGIEWQDRNHFFAVAAQAMRRILIDHARSRHRQKRGGAHDEVPLEDATQIASEPSRIDLIALDQALERLATFDGRLAQVVELKYFGGMTLDEAADVLGVSRVTIKRDWQIARAWLRNQLD